MRHSFRTATPSHEPRVERDLVLRDGRRLRVAQWGAADGRPVLFFHGRPGSRLLCPDVAATERAGVRFLAFDRPGYGRSDPVEGPLRRRDVVADVVELLDQLEIERAALVGWSGGGPHALACGAMAPDRVAAIATVCAPGRPDTERDVSAEVWEIVQLATQDPVGQRDAVRSRCRWLADDPHQLLRLTERFDPSTLEAPGMREAFTAWMNEAAAVSIEGYVDDWLMECCEPGWGFELVEVGVPVSCWFGERDQVVPPLHAELLAAGLANCRTYGCPDCGHFVPIAHWPEILERLGNPPAG
jgi:pimeloyl-ACP methyl ester carboxylesterase